MVLECKEPFLKIVKSNETYNGIVILNTGVVVVLYQPCLVSFHYRFPWIRMTIYRSCLLYLLYTGLQGTPKNPHTTHKE